MAETMTQQEHHLLALVIEDDPGEWQGIVETLESGGRYRCSVATTAKSAGRYIRGGGLSLFDVVSLDLGLGRLQSGLRLLSECVRWSKWSRSHLVVIVNTMHGDRRDQALEIGAAEFVDKADLRNAESSVLRRIFDRTIAECARRAIMEELRSFAGCCALVGRELLGSPGSPGPESAPVDRHLSRLRILEDNEDFGRRAAVRAFAKILCWERARVLLQELCARAPTAEEIEAGVLSGSVEEARDLLKQFVAGGLVSYLGDGTLSPTPKIREILRAGPVRTDA